MKRFLMLAVAVISLSCAADGAQARDIFRTPANPRGFSGYLGSQVGVNVRSAAQYHQYVSRLNQLRLVQRVNRGR